MAGDETDTASSNTAATVKQSKSQKIEPYAVPIRPENANLLPGGTVNTAGGRVKDVTFIDGLKSIRLSDLKEVHKKPCVRDALMTGIGAGFGIGGLRAVIGAPVLVACNWAAGSFVCCSFLMHEYCQRKRMLEMQGMKRAVEVIERKKLEKKLQTVDALDARKDQGKESSSFR